VQHAQQIWSYVVVDIVITGCLIAGLTLLAVSVWRFVRRPRRRNRAG